MKHTFAEYYHALVYDEKAYIDYENWVIRESKGHSLLECACGPGHLSYRLGLKGFQVDALDIDASMIDYANQHNKLPNVNYFCETMFDLSRFKTYDTIVIFLDSLNYCLSLEEFKLFLKQAYLHLNNNGILLFDIHHPNRLDEFRDEYIEEGVLLDTNYQWSIQTIDNTTIHHNIVFFENDQTVLNHVEQKVFYPDEVESLLKEICFEYERVLDLSDTDFVYDEKLYYRARKV
jgi:SAM-dependent methyltransferase